LDTAATTVTSGAGGAMGGGSFFAHPAKNITELNIKTINPLERNIYLLSPLARANSKPPY
jgi:hypothetical protein